MSLSSLAVLLLLQGEESGGEQTSGGMDLMMPMIAIFAIFYFVLIAPERKKQKARKTMLGELKKGDKVMTSSGIFASVAQIKEDEVTLIVADGVRMRFNRSAIQDILSDTESAD